MRVVSLRVATLVLLNGFDFVLRGPRSHGQVDMGDVICGQSLRQAGGWGRHGTGRGSGKTGRSSRWRQARGQQWRQRRHLDHS